MKNRKKGFTLVELLAVIVILGVLLLIAVPSVSQLLKKNKESVMLTEAQMYVNAAKLKVAEDGYSKPLYTFDIEQLIKDENEDDATAAKYSGRVFTVKDQNTRQYNYSIYMVNNETGESLGNLQGFTPDMSGGYNTNYSLNHINFNVLDKNAHTFISEPGVKKGINAKGEVKELASTFKIVQNKIKNNTVIIKYNPQKYNSKYTVSEATAQFYVINDVGDTITLLFMPSRGIYGTYTYGWMDKIDNLTFNKAYYQVYDIIKSFNDVFGDVATKIRLLTNNDLYLLLNNPPEERTVTALNQYTKKNLDQLTDIFVFEDTWGYNEPYLLIEQLWNSECLMNGPLPPAEGEESNDAWKEKTCYGIDLSEAASSQRLVSLTYSKDADGNETGIFNIPLVFEIPNENRNRIIIESTTKNLEIFNEVTNIEQGEPN